MSFLVLILVCSSTSMEFLKALRALLRVDTSLFGMLPVHVSNSAKIICFMY